MRRTRTAPTHTYVIGLLILLCSTYAAAQVPNQLNTGFPENGIVHGSNFDTVQINNGGLHVEIPIYSAKGRGLSVAAKVVYNSKGWTFHTRCFTSGGGFCEDDVTEDPLGYPTLEFFGAFDYAFATSGSTCTTGGGTGFPDISYTTEGGYTLREPDGTKHHFIPDPLIGLSGCVPPKYTATLYADDGSGWIMHINTSDGTIIEAISKNGTRVESPTGSVGTRVAASLIVDANGNQMSTSSACCTVSGWGGTDTLGRTIPPNGAYYDSTGTLQSPTFSGSVSVAINTTPLCAFSNADTCVADTSTWTLPTQLNLPNGDVYSFTYAQNGGGELASMTLPTGGQISWTWGNWDSGGRDVATRTVLANGVTGTWTYNLGLGGTVTDPAGKDTRYTCIVSGDGSSCAAVSKVEYFDGPAGSSPLIKTITTDYTPCLSSNSSCFLPIRETTTWNQQNLVTKAETDWDSMTISGVGTVTWRNPIEKRSFDWGSGVPGALLERVHSSYRHLEADGGSYLSFNIADLPTLVQKYDGAGNLLSQTNNSYDGSSLTSTGSCQLPGVPNHDYCNYSTSNLVRGNLTQASRWINTSNSWVNTNNTYDDLGNLRSTTDPGLHQTTFDYTDSWGGTGCVTASSTLAFPTTVTNAKNQRTQTSYYPCTSLTQSTRDENDIAAGRPGTTFTYDLMNRPLVTQVLDASGNVLSKTSLTYNDLSIPLSITKTITAAPDPDIVSTAYMDGLGRTAQTVLNDPEGNVATEITYDALGRKHSITNPHRSVAAATDGITQFVYDTLGRTTDVIKPDGNTVHTDYAGNVTSVTDETGRQRRTVNDGLGRLVEVDEPGDGFAGTQASGSVPVNGTLKSTTVGGQAAAPGTGSLTITGTEASTVIDPCASQSGCITPTLGGGGGGSSCPKTIYDTGSVTITVNGHSDSASYGSGSTDATVASGLATAINNDANAFVTASVSPGSTVLYLTAKQTGPGSDYSWSLSSVSSDTTGNFGPAGSFSSSPTSGTLGGGANAVAGTPVYDTGTVAVSVGSFTGEPVPYGSTTSIDVRFTNDSCSACSGTAGGGDRNLFINSITVGTTTILPSDPSVSYVGSPCNATSNGIGVLACNGDLDLTTTATGQSITVSAYGSPDLGVYPTMQLLLNGTLVAQWTVTGTSQNYTVNVPAGDTTASLLAAALASTLNVPNSPVTATATSTGINIVYKSVGQAGNVTAIVASTPSNSSLFPGGSFSGSGALANGQDSYASGLAHPYTTLYAYDSLGNLTCVEQHGDVSGTGCSSPASSDATSPWRVRRFTYDSLSRMLTSKNPETGQTTYQYDSDSNLISKTDARGVTVSYTPDALHRVTAKTYSDGTPSMTYGYDVGCCGVNPQNGVGRLTYASGGNTELVYVYDALGRINHQADCPPSGIARGFCYSINASYDDAGQMTSLTYPDGRVVTTAYSAAGRATGVNLASFNGTAVNFSYYAVPQNTSPASWGYWPTGSMNHGTYGNGVIETTQYNNRLEISSTCDSKGIATCNPAQGAIFGKTYGYYDPSGHNNGDILSIADTLAATKNQTFTYDSLNRIVTGVQADNSFNLTFSYDPWGNMKESGTSNLGSISFDVTNRITSPATCATSLAPFCYDPAGDLLMDNHNHALTYDGETRIKTVDGTSTYTYNPLGNRVRKDAGGTSTEYFFFGGNVIAELNPSAGSYTDYIFGYGKRIAKDNSNNGSGVQYYHEDQIGSARIMTDAAGNKIMDCTFNPFGEQVVCSPDNASNHYRFSGKEHDSESQLDDFGARYYSSSMGRWMTPDWSERPTTVPYAVFGDPQSLNLYLYVRNDPVSNADADGHIDDNADPDHPPQQSSCLDDFLCYVQYQEHLKDNQPSGWLEASSGSMDEGTESSDPQQAGTGQPQQQSNPGALVGNIIKNLPDGQVVSGDVVSKQIEDAAKSSGGLSDDAKKFVSNIATVTKSGNTITITNKSTLSQKLDTGTFLGRVTVNIGKTTSFRFSASGGTVTFDKFKGFSVKKGFIPLVKAVRVGPAGVEVQAAVGGYQPL